MRRDNTWVRFGSKKGKPEEKSQENGKGLATACGHWAKKKYPSVKNQGGWGGGVYQQRFVWAPLKNGQDPSKSDTQSFS